MAKSKLPEKLKGSKFTTPTFRLAFPKLFEPEAFAEGQKPSYSLVMLFRKDIDLTEMKKKMREAVVEAFGKDKAKWPTIETPWRDGNGKPDLAGYKDQVYAGAKTYNKPVVIGRDKQPIEIESDIYGGCYARAVVVAKVVEAAGKFFLTLYLQGVQKVRDGESFSGGCDVSEFDDLDDPDDDETEMEDDDDDL